PYSLSFSTVSTHLPILLFYFLLCVFFFTAPATTEIYTLSLHDALPISHRTARGRVRRGSRISSPMTEANSSPTSPKHTTPNDETSRQSAPALRKLARVSRLPWLRNT